MAITKRQVRASLEPDEPNYAAAAEELGPDALPYLTELLEDPAPGIAAKAASLAGMIGGADAVAMLQKAAASSEAIVRVTATGAAGGLPKSGAAVVLTTLVQDADVGVQKVALQAAPSKLTKRLEEAIRAVAPGDPFIASLRDRALGGTVAPDSETNDGELGEMPEVGEMPGADGMGDADAMSGPEDQPAPNVVPKAVASEGNRSAEGEMPLGEMPGEGAPGDMPTGSMT